MSTLPQSTLKFEKKETDNMPEIYRNMSQLEFYACATAISGSKFWLPLLTVLGFGISIGLNVAQKYIYVEYGFENSLWIMSAHMFASYVVAILALRARIVPPCRRRLTIQEQISVILPFSAMGALTLALGNWALLFLYPSFNSMLQNTTPFWTVVAGVVMQGKRYPVTVYLAMIPVSLGGMMCVKGEIAGFSTAGIILSLSAAAVRAGKTVLASGLMRGTEAATLDSISLLYYSAPMSTAIFLIGSFLFEGGIAPWEQFIFSVKIGMRGRMFIAGCACLAGVYNLTWYYVIKRWGAVLTTVVGNLKVPSTCVLSYLVFGNAISIQQLGGCSSRKFGNLFL